MPRSDRRDRRRGFVDVPPGNVTIEAFIAATGELFDTVGRPDTLSLVNVRPRPE
jgi:hypothetical protein